MSTQRNLCVLFADVSGSTRLYDRVGDQRALAAVDRCLAILRRVTQTYRGRVIKTIGDEIMSSFENAADGMQAASEMQQRIFDLPALDGIKLSIRVGFHFGPVMEVEGDVFGDVVNLAARMAGLAKAGQLFTTKDAVQTLPELLRMSTRDIDALAVSGKAEDVNVSEVIWQENVELTMKSQGSPVIPAATRLKLNYREIEIMLDTASAPLVMGRDASCGLVILDPRASRQHARIERRRDKFVLFDQSTNGTYLKIGNEVEAVLKHEMMPLRAAGKIGFGHAVADAGPDALEFALLV